MPHGQAAADQRDVEVADPDVAELPPAHPRRFRLAADGPRPQVGADASPAVPDLPAFRRDERALGQALNGAPHDLLRVSEAVNRGGVDPVDPQVEGVADGGDGDSVVLLAPPPGIATAADGPGAEPDHG